MSAEPRFGVWALEEGAFGSPNHPEDPHDASWIRVREQILLAEELGYDSTLVAQLTISPFGEEFDQLEAWTASAALAALTQRIEIITAIKPYLFHPVVLAKMALGIEEMSNGRFALNLVNGWFVNEAKSAGIAFYEHDERYAYGREWTTVVKSLVSGERTTFSGRYFNVEEYLLRPAPKTRARPTIYLGGESPRQSLVADEGDVWFINGQSLERVAELVKDVRSRPRAGSPVRFGLAAFVIARETDDEAQEALAYALALKAADADGGIHSHLQIDPAAVMHQTFRQHDAFVGSNGGTAAGLVGSYDRVAERIGDFHAVGIELFMLQFQPFEAEMTRFAHEVIPRVRRQAVVR